MGIPATRDFNSPRRTLYQMTVRSDRSGFGPLFDVADSTALVDKRTVSTVAPQALFMMNHPFVLEQARGVVQRVTADSAIGAEAIGRLYSVLFARNPTRQEIALAKEYLVAANKGNWDEYCQLLLCANEFLMID